MRITKVYTRTGDAGRHGWPAARKLRRILFALKPMAPSMSSMLQSAWRAYLTPRHRPESRKVQTH